MCEDQSEAGGHLSETQVFHSLLKDTLQCNAELPSVQSERCSVIFDEELLPVFSDAALPGGEDLP
jgi:hypothetical protein